MNYMQFEKIITENGWILVRTIGSSRQYRKYGCSRSVITTDSGNRKISADVLTNLEKITGLSLSR